MFIISLCLTETYKIYIIILSILERRKESLESSSDMSGQILLVPTHISSAMDWIFMSPQKSYVEMLTSKVMIFIHRALRGSWGGGQMNEITFLVKETPESSLSLSPPYDKRSRQPREDSHQNHPDLRLLGSRTLRSKFLLFISHLVYGTSL